MRLPTAHGAGDSLQHQQGAPVLIFTLCAGIFGQLGDPLIRAACQAETIQYKFCLSASTVH